MATFKKIANVKAQIKEIEAVKNSLKSKFDIEDDVPFSQYPDKISPIADGEIVFYKATSNYYDPYIPEYYNFELSGATNPTGCNGTWINQTPYGVGLARTWKIGNYACSYVASNGYWCIYDAGSTPSSYECYFRAKVLSTSEDGTTYNPIIWDNLVSGSDRTITSSRKGTSIGYEYGNLFVTLKAGVNYKFGVIQNLSNPNYMMYELHTNNPESWDALVYADSGNTETLNGHACTHVMSYTPSTSGVYRLRASGEFYNDTETIQYVCYPAPEVWSAPSENPWDYTFETNYGSGTLSFSKVTVPEHPATKTWAGRQAYKRTKEDGTVYYDFADVITENLIWSRFAPNVDEIFSADGSIKVDYLDDGTIYPANATVWTIENPSDNTTRHICVGTASGGNFIDWGDGTQTEVNSMGWTCPESTFSENARFSHTYAKAGKYTIQVIGDTVEKVLCSANSSGGSSGSESYTKELIQLGSTLTDTRYMFSDCKGLVKIADTVQFPLGLGRATEMFYSCSNLVYASPNLRFSPNMTYDHIFYDCSKLDVDITHWFDNLIVGNNANKAITSAAFYRCYKIKGTLPADKLWLDGSWGYGGTSTSSPAFYACTGLSNYNEIPAGIWR